MGLRHPDTTIDDPRHVAGSFNMVDVRRLSAHVIKLRDMPKGVLVLSGLSRVWKNRFCDPVLRGGDENVMGIHDFLCLPEWTGIEVQEEPHLDVRPTLQRLPFYYTPLAAADAVIPNSTPEDLAAGTPSDDDESDDDDACAEIPLVTPLHSAVVIPSSRKRDSRGKGIMVDDAVVPSGGVSRQRPSSGPAPSFRDVSGDAIHTDFFPFSASPYYATYLEDGEMVRVEGLSDNQLTTKMSVLHCMMMLHGGKLLARYRGLNQSHHEYVLSTYSRLKGYEEEVATLNGLELQVFTLKKQVSGLNDKLATSDASFSMSKAKGKEEKKKIKSLSKSLDNLHYEERLAEASPFVAQTDYAFLNKIFEYAAEPFSVILQLEPEKLIQQNEKQVNAVVDGSVLEMVDAVAPSKSGGVFVQGVSHVLDDVVEETAVESERISSVHTDVVVALSVGGKGNGSVPSSTVEDVVVPPSGV
uniref:Uncharacterized protein n=1 Tax=Tanacetum cinerariifolium TaxID=118510 RepID=A0A6L2MPQ4_TANCI|nr:hypothetical protein [Tanacetum cinerariifolium]